MKKKIGLLLVAIISFVHYTNAQTPQNAPGLFTKQAPYCDEFDSTALSKLWYESVGFIDNFRPTTTYNVTNYTGGVYSNNNNFQLGTSTDGTCHAAKLICRYDSLQTNPAIPLNHDTINHQPCNCNNYGTGKDIESSNVFYYGYFEIKAKLPTTVSWAGQQFWMWMNYCKLDSTYNPPHIHPKWVKSNYSEIDVFEINDCDYTLYPASMHWGTAGDSNCTSNDFAYNNDSAKHTPIVSNLSGTSGWHIYGVNWQPNFVDYFIDGNLVLHQTYIKSSNYPYYSPDHLRIDSLQPMRVVLSTGLTFPERSSPPPNGVGQNFEVDYFRYYKMNPQVNFSISGSVLTATAKEQGVKKEDYTWTNLTTSSSITSTQNDTQSVASSISLSGTINTIQVTSTTGSSRVFINTAGTWNTTAINPSTTGSTTFKVMNPSSGTCWDICQTDIISTVDNYYAKCIYSPNTSCGASPTVIINGGRNITYAAHDFVILNAGFEVDTGSGFTATAQ